jgi:spore coat protein A, manganese oxidase
MLDRRALIKLGLYGGSGALLHLTQLKSGAWGWALDEDHRDDDDKEEHHHHHHHHHKGGGGGSGVGSPPMQPFTIGLPVPPAPTRVSPSALPGIPIYNDGIPTSYYQIFERPAPVQIYPGKPATMVWGFNVPTITPGGQTYLGPTFVAKIGERVVIRMNNNLGPNNDSIVHHHGAHVGSAWDGSALWSQQIHNGTFKDFVYPNDDDVSATHWYHDHNIDFTGHNVFMGLEGFFLLYDDVELALNLPGRNNPDNPQDPLNDLPPKGELPFDLPLVIQDRAFDASFQLVYNPFASRGFLGDTFLVNGAIQPKIRVANRKYRFRILNGSNARFYHLMLQTNTGAPIPFNIVGSDGGLYKTAIQVDGFQIAPAERAEVIVDFTGLAIGTKVFLNNCLMQTDGRKPAGLVANCATAPQTPGPDGVGAMCSFDIEFSVNDRSSFTPGQTLRTDLPVYNIADAEPPVPGAKPGATHDWRFERGQGGEWLINCFNGAGAQPFDPGPPPPAAEKPRIDATCKAGTTEIWRLINGSGGWAHPVHIHRNQFQIIDRVDSGSGKDLGLLPTQLGLKDVFVLDQNVTIRLISKYTSGTTSDKQMGKYVMHCHNVEHEDMAMMIVWEVVP